MTLVIDASVAVRRFIPDERNPEADRLFRRLLEFEETGIVPLHFYAEVFSALYQASKAGRFPANEIPLRDGATGCDAPPISSATDAVAGSC